MTANINTRIDKIPLSFYSTQAKGLHTFTCVRHPVTPHRTPASVIGKILSSEPNPFSRMYCFNRSAIFCGMKTCSTAFPLFASRMIKFRSSISEAVNLSTSLIRIPPRAINSMMSRFLVFLALKMISSIMSFGRKSFTTCLIWYTGQA